VQVDHERAERWYDDFRAFERAERVDRVQANANKRAGNGFDNACQRPRLEAVVILDGERDPGSATRISATTSSGDG
jgi:hypothetical protein